MQSRLNPDHPVRTQTDYAMEALGQAEQDRDRLAENFSVHYYPVRPGMRPTGKGMIGFWLVTMGACGLLYWAFIRFVEWIDKIYIAWIRG